MRFRSTFPVARFLPRNPPNAVPVHVCRVCGYTATGWCALAEPRFVVGMCLECYGKGAK